MGPFNRLISNLSTGLPGAVGAFGDSTGYGAYDQISGAITAWNTYAFGWVGRETINLGERYDVNVEGFGFDIGLTWYDWKQLHASTQGISAPTLTLYNGCVVGADLTNQETYITDNNLFEYLSVLDAVFIVTGINDILHGATAEQFVNSYQTFIANIRSVNASVPIILSTENPTTHNQDDLFAAAQSALATDYGLSYPLTPPLQLTNSSNIWMLDTRQSLDGLNLSGYLYNNVHPNADGYQEIADWTDQLVDLGNVYNSSAFPWTFPVTFGYGFAPASAVGEAQPGTPAFGYSAGFAPASAVVEAQPGTPVFAVVAYHENTFPWTFPVTFAAPITSFAPASAVGEAQPGTPVFGTPFSFAPTGAAGEAQPGQADISTPYSFAPGSAVGEAQPGTPVFPFTFSPGSAVGEAAGGLPVFSAPTSMTDREPVDVARMIKDWLKTDFAARFPELSVRLELPADWKLGAGPVLVIADDGDPLGMWPAATSPTIRGTSWTSGRDRTYVHAALTRLLTARIPGIAAVLPGTGVLEGRDSRNGGDLASFTVRARARTAVPQ